MDLQRDKLVAGSVVAARMLVGADRERAQIAAIEVVLVELLLLAAVGRGEEQAPMIAGPGERPRIRRRRLDPLELPGPRPIEYQSTGIFGELRAELDRLLGAQMGADLEILLALRDLVCWAAAAAARRAWRRPRSASAPPCPPST